MVRANLGEHPADAYLINVGPGIENSGRVYDMMVEIEPQIAHAAADVALAVGGNAPYGSVHSANLRQPNDLNGILVIFGVAPGYRLDHTRAQNLLRDLIQEALLQASQKNCESLSMPVISADLSGFPFNVAFNIIAHEVLTFLRDNPHLSLRRVSIVAINPDKIRAMDALLPDLCRDFNTISVRNMRPSDYFDALRTATTSLMARGITSLDGPSIAVLLLNRGLNVNLNRMMSGNALYEASLKDVAQTLNLPMDIASYILFQVYVLERIRQLPQATMTRTEAARSHFSNQFMGLLGWEANQAEKWLNERRWKTRSREIYQMLAGSRGTLLASVTVDDLVNNNVQRAMAQTFVTEVAAETAATLRASGVADVMPGCERWSAAVTLRAMTAPPNQDQVNQQNQQNQGQATQQNQGQATQQKQGQAVKVEQNQAKQANQPQANQRQPNQRQANQRQPNQPQANQPQTHNKGNQEKSDTPFTAARVKQEPLSNSSPLPADPPKPRATRDTPHAAPSQLRRQPSEANEMLPSYDDAMEGGVEAPPMPDGSGHDGSGYGGSGYDGHDNSFNGGYGGVEKRESHNLIDRTTTATEKNAAAEKNAAMMASTSTTVAPAAQRAIKMEHDVKMEVEDEVMEEVKVEVKEEASSHTSSYASSNTLNGGSSDTSYGTASPARTSETYGASSPYGASTTYGGNTYGASSSPYGATSSPYGATSSPYATSSGATSSPYGATSSPFGASTNDSASSSFYGQSASSYDNSYGQSDNAYGSSSPFAAPTEVKAEPPVDTDVDMTSSNPDPAPSPAATDEFEKRLWCPITHDIMVDPVIAADGFSYERAAIEDWFSKASTSPTTGEELQSLELRPNHDLRGLAALFLEKRKK